MQSEIGTLQSQTSNDKRPPSVVLLYILQAFLGVGAIAGGGALVADPQGGLVGMSVTLLTRSPFPDFLVPGLLLLMVFGLFPLFTLYSMIRRPQWQWAEVLNPFKELHSSWVLSLYIGFGQIIWIMVQTYILNAVYWPHVLYMSLGLLIQIVTLWPPVQRYFMLDYRKERR
ncbi:hypothetical protein [Paenibacillus sp. GCM10012306]|uniref:hypothetical protein n=1 Tax=Paenibacillus sp. GCM10012306 TaxID=3317342 RepID=UPI0036182817